MVATRRLLTPPQDVRRGKPSKLVTNVTLSLPGAATINITDVVTNKLTAGWQCELLVPRHARGWVHIVRVQA